jgi:hypothetical protein
MRFASRPALVGTSGDPVYSVEHDEEVREASRRAKAQLAALRTRFQLRLAPSERILLNAPFPRPGTKDNEWMWIEVSRWDNDGTIEGTLDNEPAPGSKLTAGATVTARQAEILDYLVIHPDGRREGGEVEQILRRHAERKLQ